MSLPIEGIESPAFHARGLAVAALVLAGGVLLAPSNTPDVANLQHWPPLVTYAAQHPELPMPAGCAALISAHPVGRPTQASGDRGELQRRCEALLVELSASGRQQLALTPVRGWVQLGALTFGFAWPSLVGVIVATLLLALALPWLLALWSPGIVAAIATVGALTAALGAGLLAEDPFASMIGGVTPTIALLAALGWRLRAQTIDLQSVPMLDGIQGLPALPGWSLAALLACTAVLGLGIEAPLLARIGAVLGALVGGIAVATAAAPFEDDAWALALAATSGGPKANRGTRLESAQAPVTSVTAHGTGTSSEEILSNAAIAASSVGADPKEVTEPNRPPQPSAADADAANGALTTNLTSAAPLDLDPGWANTFNAAEAPSKPRAPFPSSVPAPDAPHDGLAPPAQPPKEASSAIDELFAMMLDATPVTSQPQQQGAIEPSASVLGSIDAAATRHYRRPGQPPEVTNGQAVTVVASPRSRASAQSPVPPVSAPPPTVEAPHQRTAALDPHALAALETRSAAVARAPAVLATVAYDGAGTAAIRADVAARRLAASANADTAVVSGLAGHRDVHLRERTTTGYAFVLDDGSEASVRRSDVRAIVVGAVGPAIGDAVLHIADLYVERERGIERWRLPITAVHRARLLVDADIAKAWRALLADLASEGAMQLPASEVWPPDPARRFAGVHALEAEARRAGLMPHAVRA